MRERVRRRAPEPLHIVWYLYCWVPVISGKKGAIPRRDGEAGRKRGGHPFADVDASGSGVAFGCNGGIG